MEPITLVATIYGAVASVFTVAQSAYEINNKKKLSNEVVKEVSLLDVEGLEKPKEAKKLIEVIKKSTGYANIIISEFQRLALFHSLVIAITFFGLFFIFVWFLIPIINSYLIPLTTVAMVLFGLYMNNRIPAAISKRAQNMYIDYIKSVNKHMLFRILSFQTKINIPDSDLEFVEKYRSAIYIFRDYKANGLTKILDQELKKFTEKA